MRYKELMAKALGPMAKRYGTTTVQRIMGFYVCWHVFGGEDQLRKAGWSDTTIWRARRDFRIAFGLDVATAWPELAETVKRLGVSNADR